MYQLNKISVPQELIHGDVFIKLDEGESTSVILKVEENGFFLYWINSDMEVTLLDISTIRDTRTGRNARLLQNSNVEQVMSPNIPDSVEDRTITIVSGPDFVNISFLTFCCGNKETAKLWCDELLKLAFNPYQRNGSALWHLRKLHTRICLQTNTQGEIPVESIVDSLTGHPLDCKKVQQALAEKDLPWFEEDTIHPTKFTFEKLFNIYKKLTKRTEIENIFDKFSKHSVDKLMSLKQLLEFVNNVQRVKEPLSEEQIRIVINTYEPDESNRIPAQMSLDGFLQYLMSEEHSAVNFDKLALNQDMDQPLSHYFINSSNMTYLTGLQLTGKCSVEMYRLCLVAGCRSVELDLWTDATGEPVVTQGFTLVTHEIRAKDVIEAIAESAFKTSDYPVVLKIRNGNCRPEQQAKVVQYCRQYFGEMLLEIPLESHPLSAGVTLPSPFSLKRRIIVISKAPSKKNFNADLDELENNEYTTSKLHTSEGISDLVTYVQRTAFDGFHEAKVRNKSFETCEFDERQATVLIKERPVEFVSHNKTHLTRIFPRGTRVDSTNYMPHMFWNSGCQLVALNFQTLDLAMQYNLGLFEFNGQCGYLLKPEVMRRKEKHFDPFVETILNKISPVKLSIKIISGQFLTHKRIGTYVCVDMYGLPVDLNRGRFRTRLIPENGLNPKYDEEAFVFEKVVCSELASLRIAVHEDCGKSIGHRVIPVTAIMPGYHHVVLRNESGQSLGLSTLFVHITLQNYKVTQETEKDQEISLHCPDKLRRREILLSLFGMNAIEEKSKHRPTKTDELINKILKRMPPPPDLSVLFREVVLKPVSFEKFLEYKKYKQKKQKLEGKLSALQKKHEKERKLATAPRNRFNFFRKLFTRKLPENPEDLVHQQMQEEREFRRNMQIDIFNCINKMITDSQEKQKKLLNWLGKREQSELTKWLTNWRKEEFKKLQMNTEGFEKWELDKIKRRITNVMVDKAVQEKAKKVELYKEIRVNLEKLHQEVCKTFEEYKTQECSKLDE